MTAKRNQQCRKRCPCGNSCTLDGQIPHQWHICHHAACPCHEQARYGATKHATGWAESAGAHGDNANSRKAVPA